MASGEIRLYSSEPGMTPEQIGKAVTDFLIRQKKQCAEGYQSVECYCIQAKSQSNALEKVAGLESAIAIEIKTDEFGLVTVRAGAARWADKIAVGAAGLAIFAPLIALPVIGASKQRQLIESVFEFIGDYLLRAQPLIAPNPIAGDQVLLQAESQAQGYGESVTCRNCGATVDSNAAFCTSCGSSIEAVSRCSECGAALTDEMQFCVSCGARVAQGNACSACGAELQQGQRFCHKCGSDNQA